jgi:hypothetical protein
MTKGSRRCRAHGCRLQASGAILHQDLGGKRRYGTMACQHHLEQATVSVLQDRLKLEDLLMLAARGELNVR